MGYSYKKLFRSPHALPKTFKVENNGTNNDLGVTAKYLELIYESDADNNWPPTSPVLEKSLKNIHTIKINNGIIIIIAWPNR